MNVYDPIAPFYRQNMWGFLYILKMFKCFCGDFAFLFYMFIRAGSWFCCLLGDLIFTVPHNSDRQILCGKVM